MRIEDLESKLNALNVPDIGTNKHQQVLKTAVLKKAGASSLSFLEDLKHMSVVKKLGSGAAMAAVILMVAFAFSAQDANNIAQAEEAVNKAFTRAVALTPEQREEINTKLETDLLESLAEAKQAPDLKYLTPEEFEAEFGAKHSGAISVAGKPGMHGGFRVFSLNPTLTQNLDKSELPKDVIFERHVMTSEAGVVSVGGTTAAGEGTVAFTAGTPAEGGMFTVGSANGEGPKFTMAHVDIKGLKVMTPAKYLKYTDSKGQVVALGIDENDVPMMKIVQFSEEQMMKMKDGAIGFPPMKSIEWEETEVK
jgi:hypothetical protein